MARILEIEKYGEMYMAGIQMLYYLKNKYARNELEEILKSFFVALEKDNFLTKDNKRKLVELIFDGSQNYTECEATLLRWHANQQQMWKKDKIEAGVDSKQTDFKSKWEKEQEQYAENVFSLILSYAEARNNRKTQYPFVSKEESKEEEKYSGISEGMFTKEGFELSTKEKYKYYAIHQTNGFWKKYEKTQRKPLGERASYDELYDDLKDSGKNWPIASSRYECQDYLCGELIPVGDIIPGDIYVYYKNIDGTIVPQFYMSVMDKFYVNGLNMVYINNSSLEYSEIDNEFLPELIRKLRQIDRDRNIEYIKFLRKKYKDYKKAIALHKKDSFSQKELLFLYRMAYVEKDDLALDKVEMRNIQEDFEHFTDENKIELFLTLKDTEIVNKIRIDSRDILRTLAEKGSIQQFKNTSEETIKDKNFVIEVLEKFYQTPRAKSGFGEFFRNLPEEYTTDIEVLESALLKYSTALNIQIASWIQQAENKEELVNNRQYLYRLINAFAQSLINDNKIYYGNSFLWIVPTEILTDIEKHVLIGPQSTPKREKLARKSYKVLVKDKEKVLEYRRTGKF